MSDDITVFLARRLIEQSDLIAEGFTTTAQHIKTINDLFALYEQVILNLHKRIEQLEKQ